ncbi:MAG TPA: urea ABC transporter substrate-binding protein [Actinomycetota bacterium]|jgi:urea transport system substrate-binding protein|nr:urea ABC transporter substrate-binding protein [Actinomycetota bacterium]
MKEASRRKRLWLSTLMVLMLLGAACGQKTDDAKTGGSTATDEGDTIKVGLLHSLSGTMAISEVTVRDAELLAIEQINAKGGVLGKQIEPIEEDGASDWPTFAEKAQKLISVDKVATVFGGWTSASRKAMLPVFEKNKALLWYPVQYEGLEQSPYIFYTGATTNQQIVPGLDYLKGQGKKKVFLVGSDYVFPRTANKEIKAYAEANDMEIVGEEYIPLGNQEVATLVNKVVDAKPDAIFNTLNGDTNTAFFKEYKTKGITPESVPIISVSVAEEEVRAIGPEFLAGHLVAWNYYQTTDTPENTAFVAAFKDKYGDDKVTSDPMEAGYVAVNLWAAAVEKAGTTDVDEVIKAAAGLEFAAPEGMVTVDGPTQHIHKTARIGLIGADGLIKQVSGSEGPIKPDPYLKSYDWAKGLS